MLRSLSTVCLAIFLSATCALAQSNNLIEPDAGTWKTWVITSGKDFRVPPPPDSSAAELKQLRDIIANACATFRPFAWPSQRSRTDPRRLQTGGQESASSSRSDVHF